MYSKQEGCALKYVISDIHGEYDRFISLLKKIHFSDADVLYVLGDVLDRGPKPIECILYMMKQPNMIPLIGNHEYMAMQCIPFLLQEITEETINSLTVNQMGKILDWQYNGSKSTLSGFKALDEETRKEVIEYLCSFELYKEVTAGATDYLLVHAGLGNFSPNRSIDDYDIDELVWDRPDYNTPYFNDIYTVTGHTPTFCIEGNLQPGFIYRANNHIAIDCGACFPEGRLAVLCLDTGEEFYS